MTSIALEEAFALPSPDTGQPPWGAHRSIVRREIADDWTRRLADFTEYRLPEMDAHGIDIQVLSLTVPGIQADMDTRAAVESAVLTNDFLAKVISEHPDRFRGFAAVPMQDPEAAVTELRRCVTELGFCGVLVNDHTRGHYLDEPQYDPFWSELEALRAPLYIHPNIIRHDDWHVLQGHPELQGALWSFGAETAAHALRIVFSGVFDRHPDATLILGHMGEFLPFQRSRLNSRYRTLEPEFTLGRLPSEYFGSNIVFTTSGVFSPTVLEGIVLEVGADSVMFSIDYPYEPTAEAVRGFEAARLSDEDRAKIARLNARRILRLGD
jgi:2,3-dihydroxybenzoate decarboxylase